MKILYVISTLKNCGPVNVLYSLCSELSTKAEITVLTLSPEPTDSRWQDFKRLEIELKSLKLTRFEYVFYGRYLFNKLIKKNSYNIIHSHGYRADQLVSECHSKLTVSTAHNNPSNDYLSTYGTLIGFLMAKRQLKYWNQFGSVVACSAYIGKQIQNSNVNNVKFIHNGTKKIMNKRKTSVPIKLLVLGSINERKNVEFILRAFTSLKKISNLQLIIVGTGKNYDDLVEKYESKKIIFTGQVKDPSNYLQSSQWLISASKSEGLPMSVIEALSANCNLLLSNIGPHREIERLDQSKNICRLFSLKDIEELKKIFLDINYDKIRYVDGGYQIWEKNFTDKIMSDNYFELYKKLCNQKK